MDDSETVAQAILGIEMVLREHLEPGRPQDPQLAIERILTVLDASNAGAAAARLADWLDCGM